MAPKLLLVEDNEMNRDMLSRLLQRRGYEVGNSSQARVSFSKGVNVGELLA